MFGCRITRTEAGRPVEELTCMLMENETLDLIEAVGKAVDANKDNPKGERYMAILRQLQCILEP